MNKQSPERLEYLRNYRKNHKEQQRKYQKKYIDKLRQQGKYPISTSMKLRNEIEELQQELQRKDNIIKDAKEVLLTTNNIEKALNVLDRTKELEESK